jgi:hypothetical protein
MDDVVGVVDVFNEFLQEYFGFGILWQPNTPG